MSRWAEERQVLCHVCQELARTGLVIGSSGNASLRLLSQEGDLVLITPLGRPCDRLTPQELAVIDLEGEPVEEDLPPSSESALHLFIYRRRADVGGVVHTHPIFSSVAAVALDEIPPIIDEMVIKIGGSVKVAEYAFPGTEELAERACEALEDRKAVLLRHHGLLAVGKTIQEALEISQLVERLAHIFLYTYLMKAINPLPPQVVNMEEELYRMRRLAEGANRGDYGNST